MNHGRKTYKLGRDSKQRTALWYSLSRSLILYGKIITTDAKAKSLVKIISKLITLAKEENTLSNYRRILSFMRQDEVAAKKLVEYGKIFAERKGGYVSVIKVGQRLGDSAHVSCVRLLA